MLDNCCSSSSKQQSFSSNKLTNKKSPSMSSKANKIRLLTMAKKVKSNTNRSLMVVQSSRKKGKSNTMMFNMSRRLCLVYSNRRKKEKKNSILRLTSKNIISISSNRTLSSSICRKTSLSTMMKIKTWSKLTYKLKMRKSLKRMLNNNLRCSIMTTKENNTSKLKKPKMLMLKKRAKKSYKSSIIRPLLR